MIVTITGSGTSQGVPVIGCECKVCLSKNEKDKRLRSSIHILYKQKSIVIDTGPDFRQQMINNNIKNLDAVLFTHEHKDHVAGLDDIRPFNFIQKKPIDIFCSQQVFKALKREFHYIFDPKFQYPGIPKINRHQISKNKFLIGEKIKLLKENLEVTISLLEDKPLSIELPKNIACIVETTDAVVKGQTAASSYKPAKLDNGLNIQVPPFIETGDEVIVDTRNFEYIKKI